jgi:NADPH2:quinone reductase
VFYAGALDRPGTNAEYHLVDERIVGRKPGSLDWSEAAALPLTTITAWEALFDRLDILRPVPGAAPAVLIIGGAGGVGSIAIQFVRRLTDLIVVATASRSETRAWVCELGAHYVIDHAQPLSPQIGKLGCGPPGFVLSTTHTGAHLPAIAELIAPQGRFALIDDAPVFDINPFKPRASRRTGSSCSRARCSRPRKSPSKASFSTRSPAWSTPERCVRLPKPSGRSTRET